MFSDTSTFPMIKEDLKKSFNLYLHWNTDVSCLSPTKHLTVCFRNFPLTAAQTSLKTPFSKSGYAVSLSSGLVHYPRD